MNSVVIALDPLTMSAASQIAEQIDKWLTNEQLRPLNPHGTACFALIDDPAKLEQLNLDAREFVTEWDDDWCVVGEDGAGNYFCVSRAGAFPGVRQFDHEWSRLEDFMPSLRAYFDYFASIARNSRTRENQ